MPSLFQKWKQLERKLVHLYLLVNSILMKRKIPLKRCVYKLLITFVYSLGLIGISSLLDFPSLFGTIYIFKFYNCTKFKQNLFM